ncbi:hypothetical protein ACQ4PT_033522 [Festuca glaucescens]
MGRPGCRDKCGGMSIPFPFGMDKPACFLPGFEVTCNTSFTPPRAFLAYNHNDPPYEAIYRCKFGTENTGCKYRYQPVELFGISLETSERGAVPPVLVGVGWSVKSSMSSQIKPYPDLLSCTSNDPFRVTAPTGSCSGLGCCRIALPPPWPTMPVIETAVILEEVYAGTNTFWKTNPCSYGMVVEGSWYNFTAEDMDGYEVLSKATSASAGSITMATPTSPMDAKVTAPTGLCSGLGCCRVALSAPWPTMPVIETTVILEEVQAGARTFYKTNPCSYGMVVEGSWYNFTDEDMAGYEVLSKKLGRDFPLALDFAIRNGSCERDGCPMGNTSCANAAYDAEG